nr:L-aspartate oxidase [Klebsiella pneumoniae]
MLFDTQVVPMAKRAIISRAKGHSHRRILHAADATGKAVETTLVDKALAHPNIRILERSNAVDLIVSDKIGLPGTRRVVGAWFWNRNKERVETCSAKAVVLATGGAAKVYQYTTNPDVSSGDGIAMAWRAGCRVANLEFNQFHPTALYHPRRVISCLLKRCAAKAPTLNARMAPALCRTLTSAASWPRAISSPAPSTMK